MVSVFLCANRINRVSGVAFHFSVTYTYGDGFHHSRPFENLPYVLTVQTLKTCYTVMEGRFNQENIENTAYAVISNSIWLFSFVERDFQI